MECNYFGLKGSGMGLFSSQAINESIIPFEKLEKIGSAMNPK